MPSTWSKWVGQTLPEGSVWCAVAVESTGVADAFRTEEEGEEMNWKQCSDAGSCCDLGRKALWGSGVQW